MARRPAAPQPPQPATLSVDQMRRGIDRINKRIADLEAFDPRIVQKRWGPEVAALETAIKETLAAVYGHNTVEYKRYAGAAKLDRGPVIASSDASWISARSGNFGGSPRDDMREVYRYLTEGKQGALMLLRQAIRGLEEEIADRQPAITPAEVRDEAEPSENDARIPVQRSVQTLALELLKAIEAATRGSEVPVILGQLNDLQMTEGEARAAFNYLKDAGLISANFAIRYSARLTAAGHDAIVAAGSSPDNQQRSSDKSLPHEALTAIREAVQEIKMRLPSLGVSNAATSEIQADISQITAETERPTPRRRFMKLSLESLRDNLAKAAGAGSAAALVGLVVELLAKFFGVF